MRPREWMLRCTEKLLVRVRARLVPVAHEQLLYEDGVPVARRAGLRGRTCYRQRIYDEVEASVDRPLTTMKPDEATRTSTA